jgi:hypothetical protein
MGGEFEDTIVLVWFYYYCEGEQKGGEEEIEDTQGRINATRTIV